MPFRSSPRHAFLPQMVKFHESQIPRELCLSLARAGALVTAELNKRSLSPYQSFSHPGSDQRRVDCQALLGLLSSFCFSELKSLVCHDSRRPPVFLALNTGTLAHYVWVLDRFKVPALQGLELEQGPKKCGIQFFLLVKSSCLLLMVTVPIPVNYTHLTQPTNSLV